SPSDSYRLAFSCAGELERGSATGNVVPEFAQDAAEIVVGALGGMVEEGEAADAGRVCELDGLPERAVSPTYAARVLGVGEHGIVEEEVGAGEELDEPIVSSVVDGVSPADELVVGDVGQGRGAGVHAEA